ncbi:MAG: SWIM zinc finger family protein, partial [Planctomycetes bacterium]|nr:SWIM zinc finger family protein [Planctomycetota bacterium]
MSATAVQVGSVSRGDRPAARRGRPGPARRKTPYRRKPEGMTLEQWQIALRHEFGADQKYRLKNLGGGPVFSEFAVSNPQSARTYRIVIRGRNPGDSFCNCPDFAVNTLGTCKHVGFVLSRLERKPGARSALERGFHPAHPEIFLRYGAKRDVVFRAAGDGSPSLRGLVSRHFGADGALKPEAYARFETFLREASSRDRALRCYEDALAYVAQVRDQARLRERVD